MQMAVALIALLMASTNCAFYYTAQELRETEITLIATFDGLPNQIAKCVQERYEIKGDFWIPAQLTHLRVKNESWTELLSLTQNNTVAIVIDFTRAENKTTMKAYQIPYSVGGETTRERVKEATRECGGTAKEP